MTQDWTLEEALAYYRRQGAPGSRGRWWPCCGRCRRSAAAHCPPPIWREIAAALSLRDTFLSAIIRRYPGLRTEEAPTAWSCAAAPRCSGRGAARLAAFVEETYGVRPGGVSASGRFTYRITGCMKNCPNGPSLRWDGALHSRADEALSSAPWWTRAAGGLPLDSFPPLCYDRLVVANKIFRHSGAERARFYDKVYSCGGRDDVRHV